MKRLQLVSTIVVLGMAMAVAGCDNIEWGGAELAVAPPPPREVDPEEAPLGPGDERIPDGPMLYRVRAEDDVRAIMLPVGEVGPDTLMPIQALVDWQLFGDGFISRHLREGTELSLFRRGARVGTLVVQTAAVPDEGVCPRVPRARGVMELMAGIDPEGEFLGMAKPHAPTPALGSPHPDEPAPVMRRLAPILAERLLRARRAPLPGNWQRAMAQVTPFPMADSPDPAFATTFVVGDTLAPTGRTDGHSLFFIGEPVPRIGYDTAFVQYADYERHGRAARAVVDFLDWDRSGQVGLLLHVYGQDESWSEAVMRVDGEWRQVLSDRCPPPAAPAPAEPAAPAEVEGEA